MVIDLKTGDTVSYISTNYWLAETLATVAEAHS